MLQIENTIVSLDIIEKKFACDISKCKGACCIHGDSGAPLDEDETKILEQIFEKVKPFLRPDGVRAIEKQGKWVTDADGDFVTPLIEGKECAYVIFENDIAVCAIEKAFYAGKIKYQKPISCHLYPIRITKYTEFEAINYHCWEICKHALSNGDKLNTTVFEFTKDALGRKYGKSWIDQLVLAKEIIEHNSSTKPTHKSKRASDKKK